MHVSFVFPGRISVTRIALNVSLPQQRKCVTVFCTAETCHVLMFAQPPTQICLQSRAKAAQSAQKNVEGKCLPWVMIPACLASQKLRETHLESTNIYVFRGIIKRPNRYKHTKAAIENK